MTLDPILFVTPALPSPLGTGSMLRAAATLDALAHRFQVHVLNLNVWSCGVGRSTFVHERAASYVEMPAHSGEIDTATLLPRSFPNIDFVAIHTFRLVMARITMGILPTLPRRPYLVLDLDDDEGARSTTLLRLMEQEGDLQSVRRGRADQTQLRMLERMMVPRFDTIALAGTEDCIAFRTRYPQAVIRHLPNAIRLPPLAQTPARKPAGTRPRIVFVGALYYAPNVDALCFFVQQVMPLLEAILGEPIRFDIVGAEPVRQVSALAEREGVTVYPNVPSVEPFYEQADLCIVPLRAGSGTRIKILEAFSHRRPVVSTALGAEGLEVVDGEHLLLAESPDAIATACAQILRDPALRTKLVANAYDWVSNHHTAHNVQIALDHIYQPIIESATNV